MPIISGEIAEDVTSYYAVSEQTPTVCALGVLVNPDLSVRAAGGYLIQLLPGAGEDVIQKLEQSLEKVRPVTEMIQSGMTPAEIVHTVLDGFSPDLLRKRKSATGAAARASGWSVHWSASGGKSCKA